MKIYQLVIVGLLAIGLGGCPKQLPSLNLSTNVTYNTVEGVQAAYGTALSTMRTYKSLPLCRTGTKATLLNPCAQRSIIEKLQAADLRASGAIREMVSFINRYPTVDATNVISAASTAVQSLESVINQNGV